MAGKVSGATGGVPKGRGNTIPTARWDKFHEIDPAVQGAAGGTMLKKALKKSKNAKGIAKGV